MDIEQLYLDHNVQYVTEGHKHSRPGWVNVICPFCTGNPGYHLGYDTEGDKFVCWRCGGHYAPKVISAVLSVSFSEAFKILRQYGVLIGKVKEKRLNLKKKAFKLPSEEALGKNHRKYLVNRGFDPDKLAKDWNLFGTGPMSMLGKLNYKHRIIIPFIWNNQIVSFDSRDITNKAQNKYMACPENREVIGHKDILYGRQDLWGDAGICVEGPTDVWKMGFNAFAVSGIKYKPKQVREIKKHFKRVAVVFDDDPQAQVQAKKLISDLRFRGVEAFNVEIKGDPGSLPEKEIQKLLKQIL